MSQPYVTGPAGFLVQPVATGTPQFFGTSKRTPRISIRREYEEVWNSIAGTKIPFDLAYQGTHAFVTATFTRLKWPVLHEMEALLGIAGSPGLDDGAAGDIGTLMLTEGRAFPLWVRFPYAAKAVFSAGGLVPGFHFHAASLIGPDELDELGTTATEVSLTWHCLRAWNPTLNRFTCFDHSMADVAAIAAD